MEVTKLECIPFILPNLSEERISLKKGEILRHLEEEDITVEEITTGTMFQNLNIEVSESNCDVSSEKAFITSPTDVDTHRKVKLQVAEVLDHYKKEFEKLCEEYNVVCTVVHPVVSVDSFLCLYAQLVLYMNNMELMLLCI